ncbi:MAG: hypothetical protein AWM53_01177 [Candidatus Dichloromethanomonas elyunquensis]|nr:MAG: hypothetical protein AWM53_01177 [Candidatus Dichloromethanomonas elyunquensis]
MEEKLTTLKEYVHMDSEISFEEFKTYYSSFIGQLNAEYNEMDQGTCLKARFICSIVKANAETRSHQSKTNAKAFRKMADKCGFWMEAIDHRLKKEGLPQAAIDTAMNEINKRL